VVALRHGQHASEPNLKVVKLLFHWCAARSHARLKDAALGPVPRPKSESLQIEKHQVIGVKSFTQTPIT
jgi:hypothetical protein